MQNINILNDCLRAQQQAQLQLKKRQTSVFISIKLKLLKQMGLNYKAPNFSSPLGKQLLNLFALEKEGHNKETILFLNDLIKEPNLQVTDHAEFIFASLLKSIIQVMENRLEISPQIILALLKLFQTFIKSQDILWNMNLDLLEMAIEFTAKQLVFQDREKTSINQDLINRGFDVKSDSNYFISLLNGIMLRVMEKVKPQSVFNTLVHLCSEFIKSDEQTKTIGLFMKCAYRVASSYTKEFNVQRVGDTFVQINQFFVLDPPNHSLNKWKQPKNQSSNRNKLVYSMKTIISQLCKCLDSSEVWQLYFMSAKKFIKKDIFIAPFLEIELEKNHSGQQNQSGQWNQFGEIKDLRILLDLE